MKLPGFTGEASLYNNRGGYIMERTVRGGDEGRVYRRGGVEPASICDTLKRYCQLRGGRDCDQCVSYCGVTWCFS